MKKFLTAAASIVIAAAMCAGFSACTTTDEPTEEVNTVSLVATDQDNVGRMSGVDYYVVPEPAATAKVKALTNAGTAYYNVGSLQSLYGENGYPQAVIVAKSSLIESDGKFVKEFIEAYKTTDTWLASQTDYTEIVNKINSNGGTSLKAAAINSTVVSNCSIKFVSATEDKANIIGYMDSVKKIASNMYGECEDAFFQDISAITDTVSESKTEISVYMPDGAPALSMAYMMSGEVTTLSKTVTYNVVTSSSINTYVTNTDETQNADICVLPVDAAARLLGSGEKYKLLGTVTHGNLFIISSGNTEITAENIGSVLNGKTVGVVNLAAVPGLTFKMVLGKYGVEYTQENS